jgi:hypothetical protein
MLTSEEQRKNKQPQSERTFSVLLTVLLALLIIGTVCIVSGHLHLIPWPVNVNIVLIVFVLLDLGVIIVSVIIIVGGPWLHTSISADEPVLPNKLPEQHAQPATSNAPSGSSNPPCPS